MFQLKVGVKSKWTRDYLQKGSTCSASSPVLFSLSFSSVGFLVKARSEEFVVSSLRYVVLNTDS